MSLAPTPPSTSAFDKLGALTILPLQLDNRAANRGTPCRRYASNVIVDSEAFRANRAAHLELIARISRAGSEGARGFRPRPTPNSAQRGQLPPRERVNLLLDRDAPFLELSTLCGLGMHEDDGIENVYGGGSIVGIGMISGARCMIAANDSGIKGGAAHPMGVEKAIRAQEIALREQTALRATGRERRRQSVAAGRDVRARRRDLRQHGAAVGGRHSRDLDRAWLLDRRRRLSDRASPIMS